VVVGDQSSGKSSVLEAITELPFPTSSIRCTRFATQIKLRHAPENSLRMSIIPDSKRSPQERQRLSQFPSTFPPTTPFADIMDLATKTICPENNSSFCSRDIFSIEMSGPNKPHLTIVDLPGLIQAANNHQTQADVDAIRNLAYSYMQNERTIILAIVSCASDLELQPILAREARQFDPLGSRTLGVLTKPDKTETSLREAQFLELARNENIKYKLGWHVLRNRTPAEKNNSSEERRRVEKEFFGPQSTWAQLGPDQLGIDTLRTKLSKELVKHVMHEMPKVQEEIRTKLEEVKAALAKLGNRKDTPEEMRDELRELCEKSQALTRSAMEGQYIDLYGPAFFHPSPQTPAESLRKLRARIVLQNERFAEEMATLGHLVEIVDETPGSPGAPPVEINTNHPLRMSRNEFIRTHVEPLLDASPGLELRMDRNPLLVYTLFRSYSEHWPTIATRHIDEIQAICADFLQEIVDFAWPEDMRGRAWEAFVETKMEDRLQASYKEAAHLFKDRTRASKPYDKTHAEKVIEWIAERNKKQAGGGFLSEFAPDAFLQKMLVYYELTLKTFVSNVIVQVVERHLVDELDRIFNITRVVELSDDAIIQIASEDEYSRQQRLELRERRRTLEAGERICRKYMARRDLKLVCKRTLQLPSIIINHQQDTPQPIKILNKPMPARRKAPERNEPAASYQQPIANQQPKPQRNSDEVPTPKSNRHSGDRSSTRNYAPPSVQETSQQATGTIPSSAEQQYNPSSYPNSQYSAVPSYGRYDPYEAAPNIPPRPAAVPPLPPKRQENGDGVRDDSSSDHRANRQGNFLGKAFKRAAGQ
jgi:GTP-binding protein EngB required for normal cell division